MTDDEDLTLGVAYLTRHAADQRKGAGTPLNHVGGGSTGLPGRAGMPLDALRDAASWRARRKGEKVTRWAVIVVWYLVWQP
jgi:hypothetical protein